MVEPDGKSHHLGDAWQPALWLRFLVDVGADDLLSFAARLKMFANDHMAIEEAATC